MENKYGKLTIIKRVDAPEYVNHKLIFYLCKCQCGNETIARKDNLTNGNTTSCGCKKEKHGMRNTRFYKIWCAMKNRCNLKTHKSYKNYGGRGIEICKEWNQFENFMNDMYQSYLEFEKVNGQKSATIDRVDVNGNYELSNCKWSTDKEQARNRRTNIEIEIDGITYKTIREVSEKFNIPYTTIMKRYNKGKRGIELTTKSKGKKIIPD